MDITTLPLPIALEDGQFVALEIPEAELPVPPPSPPAKKWRGRVHAQGPSVDAGVPSSEKQATENPTGPEIAIADIEMKDAPKIPVTNGNRDSQLIDPASSEVPLADQMPATLNSSSVISGTPALPSNSGMTAMDLVRQMQRSSVGSTTSQKSLESSKIFVPPSLPSVYNTAFTPTMSEKAQLSPRLGTTQRRSPSFNTPELTSSAIFNDQLVRQQREIQMRPTPQQGFQPPPSWDTTYGQTPTGMDSMFRAFEKQQGRTPSPFASPLQVNGRSPQNRSSAMVQPAPFGVIGQARPPSSGTPTSGQGWP